MKGIDCTSQITQEIGQELFNQGINYVARYLVPEWGNMLWKRLTKEECQVMTDLGIKILSVFEISAGDMIGGHITGMAHGKLAYEQTQLIGQPTGTFVFFAVDYDAQSEDYDLIEQYLKAAAEQLPGYKIGVYGSFYVTEEMANRKACEAFWQTYAWSGGNLSEIGRDIYQYQNGVSLAGIEVDMDDFYYEDINGGNIVWNYDTPPMEEPKPEPDYRQKYTEVVAELSLLQDRHNNFVDRISSMVNGDRLL